MSAWKTMGTSMDLLKKGTKQFSGLDESVFKNCDACTNLAEITRTSLGPNGFTKLLVNHLGKLFVSSDTATIIQQLEVQHPAAKMVIMASQQQEQEVGDGTNFVICFAGELLKLAKDLVVSGLHTTEIATGYEKASEKALEILETLALPAAAHPVDFNSAKSLATYIRPVVGAKQRGMEDMLSDWIAEACVLVMPKDPRRFNVDNVRVAKITGGGVQDTTVVKGMVVTRDTEGSIKHVKQAKVAVYSCGLETGKTDTKGTVLLNGADSLLAFSKGEEQLIEEQVKAIADSGAKVIVTGGTLQEMYLHYCEKYGLMVLKALSKFDVRRLAKATGAHPLVKLEAPQPQELGFCDSVSVEEIGSTRVCIFRQDMEESGISTIVIRGSTKGLLDDVERAVDDGVNTVKCLTKDTRVLPGAGAVEMELATRLAAWGETCAGLEQYAIKKFAQALEVIPRTIAENAGLNATDNMASLYAAHSKPDGSATGVDIEGTTLNAESAGILDLFANVHWGIRHTVDAVATVLRVDQIIMSKPAGGPKPPAQGPRDDDDGM